VVGTWATERAYVRRPDHCRVSSPPIVHSAMRGGGTCRRGWRRRRPRRHRRTTGARDRAGRRHGDRRGRHGARDGSGERGREGDGVGCDRGDLRPGRNAVPVSTAPTRTPEVETARIEVPPVTPPTAARARTVVKVTAPATSVVSGFDSVTETTGEPDDVSTLTAVTTVPPRRPRPRRRSRRTREGCRRAGGCSSPQRRWRPGSTRPSPSACP